MKHVRITEDNVGARPHGRPRVLRGIAIVGIHADLFAAGQVICPLHEIVELIVGERLRWVKIQRPGIGILQDPLEHRQVIAEGFSGSCRSDDHQIRSASGQVERLRLMRVQLRYRPLLERLTQSRIDLRRKIHQPRLPGRDVVIPGNGIAFLELRQEFWKGGRFRNRGVLQDQL